MRLLSDKFIFLITDEHLTNLTLNEFMFNCHFLDLLGDYFVTFGEKRFGF